MNSLSVGAGAVAPCPDQQARLQRGSDDGAGRHGGPEDPGPLLHPEPAPQPGGGGPGDGFRQGPRGPGRQRGAVHLPSPVRRRLLSGEETPNVFFLILLFNVPVPWSPVPHTVAPRRQ